MPRKARLIVPDCPHHIVQRGHNRAPVFIEERDYKYYLRSLAKWRDALGVRVYAYCLMTNHVHLILDPGGNASAISSLMKRVAGRQTRYVNTAEKRTGTIWEGRYKSSPIETEEYLLACLRYVELNPVWAGIVNRADEYRWSSYRVRVGLGNDFALDLDYIYLSLAVTPEERVAVYKRFIGESVDEEESRIIGQRIRRGQITGTPKFARTCEQRLGVRVSVRGPGRPRLKK